MNRAIPILIPSLLFIGLLLFHLKCNDRPLVSPDIQKLQQLEYEKRCLIDSVNRLLQRKVDTVYINRTRIKIKNDSIFIYQSEVGNLPKDSAAKFLIEWTSKPAIHD